jgi:aryl-alcohol dehydrogenase-like predicted oxidoreductase
LKSLVQQRASISLGVGTYRVRADLRSVLPQAWAAGCRLVDTAATYRHGRAHGEIAKLIEEEIGAGHLSGPAEITIMTKVGFRRSEDGHSLDADFLREEIAIAGGQLEPAAIDTLFLHNPEVAAAGRSQDEFFRLLRAAIEVCEEARAGGSIRRYGVATWSAFAATDGRSPLSVGALDALASEVAGGDHGLRSVQLPVSLIRSEAAVEALAATGPIVDAASRAWSVFASSPLHGGQLPPLLTADFLRLFPNSTTPAQACVLFAASVPGVTAVLVGPRTVEQFDELFSLREETPLTVDELRPLVVLVS